MKYVGADLHKKSITFSVVELKDMKTKLVKNCKMLCKEIQHIVSFFRSIGISGFPNSPFPRQASH
jgi:hypothetical protein